MREKPDVILTTGAAVAIPMCVIGKLFRKKVIYIESFARMTTPNKTGLLIYKFADLFIIQWEALKSIILMLSMEVQYTNESAGYNRLNGRKEIY